MLERERARFLAPEKEGEYGAEEVEMGGEDRRERRKEEREKKSPLATEHYFRRERDDARANERERERERGRGGEVKNSSASPCDVRREERGREK